MHIAMHIIRFLRARPPECMFPRTVEEFLDRSIVESVRIGFYTFLIFPAFSTMFIGVQGCSWNTGTETISPRKYKATRRMTWLYCCTSEAEHGEPRK
jgi:hypothetical protein